MAQRIFLVDTDPGVDDCAALMMLFSQIPKVKVVGLTCAAGNVAIRDVTINAARIVKLFNLLDEIPIFGGCTEAMVSFPSSGDAGYYHGKDGLGDSPDVYPQRSEKLLDHVQSEHGVNAIIRLAKQYDGQLELICLGALTNIAIAAKLDPDLPKRLKNLHILGGTIRACGNHTPCAEYNFFTDPEAAYNVFRTFPQHCATQVVPYETAAAHGVPPKKLDAMISGKGKRKEFFRAAFNNTCRKYEDQDIARGINIGYSLCDTYMMAVILDSNVVKKALNARVTVELGGISARASFIIDRASKGSPHISQSPVKIIEELDDAIYQSLLSKAFEE